MRLVSLENVKGNEILAKSVIDMSGRVLLSKGMRLKLSYLNRFHELGISCIYIEDKISEGIEIEDVLCDETRFKAKEILQNEVQRYTRFKSINTDDIQGIVNVILDETLNSKAELINLKDLKIKDEYTFSHCVNVCMLSIFLAIKAGLDRDKIQSLGTGCLLHDLGKILIPTEMLQKPEKLTDDEFEEMKNHPVYGYEAINNELNINATSKVVVLLHHERIDGTGYPLGLKGDETPFLSRIVAVADAFDAMMSNRVYRSKLDLNEAKAQLIKGAGTQFDKKVVDNFLKLLDNYDEMEMKISDVVKW
jgi:HD-GYP domain-containing protein (c-di-GMP phosphodiesterase class II)